MKILLVITKGEVGGAQMSVLNLARGFKREGHEVMVGFGEGSFLKDELEASGIPSHNFRWLRRSYNPLANIFFIFEVKKFLDNNPWPHAESLAYGEPEARLSRTGCDIAHFNSSNALFGAIGAKLASRPPKTVFTLRGLSLLDKNHRSPFMIKFFYKQVFKFLLRFIDKPVFVCGSNLEYALREKIIRRGRVVYNGIDPANIRFLEKIDARNEIESRILGNPKTRLSDAFIIGSIGRLAYPKNYEFIINNFKEIESAGNARKIRFIIIGDGPERKKYENLILENGLGGKIILAGEIPNASRLIKAFDIFILPSIFEGLSVTLIEALFAGVPILTTKVGGSPELTGNDEHQLYTLNDKQEFIKKLSELVNNQALRDKISEENLERSKIFLIDNTVRKYLEIYENKQ